MLIIEIHVETIENSDAHPSTAEKRSDEEPKRGSDKSNSPGSRFWKTFKHRVPGYLIQYHKNEK